MDTDGLDCHSHTIIYPFVSTHVCAQLGYKSCLFKFCDTAKLCTKSFPNVSIHMLTFGNFAQSMTLSQNFTQTDNLCKLSFKTKFAWILYITRVHSSGWSVGFSTLQTYLIYIRTQFYFGFGHDVFFMKSIFFFNLGYTTLWSLCLYIMCLYSMKFIFVHVYSAHRIFCGSSQISD